MKKSLAHLSYRKRADLARITTIIRRTVPQTEITVLFASYAIADAVEDITVPGRTTCEYSSDFDIRVIVPKRYTLQVYPEPAEGLYAIYTLANPLLKIYAQGSFP